MVEVRIIRDMVKLELIALLISLMGFFLDHNDWKENTTLWNSKGEIFWLSLMTLALISAFYFPLKYNKKTN